MSPDLISVIIPAHNSVRYIRETVDSVLAQQCVDVELIVVDDSSTDGTYDVLASYGKDLRLIRQKNAGVCAARNHGIRLSTGRYIALLDHDDYWYPNKLDSQLECFRQHPDAGLVYGDFRRWEESAEGTFATPDEFAHDAQTCGIDAALSGWIYHTLLLDCVVLTSTAMIPRHVLDACGSFDESLPYSEDWDLWLRISRRFRFLKLKQLVTLYRHHRSQGSRTPRELNYAVRLIEKAVATWGYESPDGTRVDAQAYRKHIADLHFYHGYLHLHAGLPAIARHSLWQAWRTRPESARFLAYALLSFVKRNGAPRARARAEHLATRS